MKFHTLHRLKFCDQSGFIRNKMGCFNDPAWKVFGWWGGVGLVADTNYLYPARWGWINILGLLFVLKINWKSKFSMQC